jgi:hypothetical protein
MRLMIRLRALESGQERVVDVDALPRQLDRELVRENLHVAGQHHQFDLALLDDAPDLRLLLRFGLCSDRQIVEWNALEIVVSVGLARVVGDRAYCSLMIALRFRGSRDTRSTLVHASEL